MVHHEFEGVCWAKDCIERAVGGERYHYEREDLDREARDPKYPSGIGPSGGDGC